MNIRSSLARCVAGTPKDETELRAMCAALWHERGVVAILDLGLVRSADDRTVIERAAARLYGERGVNEGNKNAGHP